MYRLRSLSHYAIEALRLIPPLGGDRWQIVSYKCDGNRFSNMQ
jgi:hypothetical protein